MVELTGYDKFIQQALKYGFSLWGTAKTGQTTQYRTGDDGDLEKGYPKNPPRFTDNGDGTITDNATGLMWVKDPTLNTKNWNDAIDYCLALNYAGHNDWRLPNINELGSLVDRGRSIPAINTTYFPNATPAPYWTSTTMNRVTTSAGLWDFFDGTLSYGAKGGTGYVRPVRCPM